MTPAAHLLSNHYNLSRSRYYRELDKTSKGDYKLEGFLAYAIGGFIDGIREQLDTVRAETLQVTWSNFVHESFQDREETKATNRQKHLVLDLGTAKVAASKIRELTPRLAMEYAGKTSKTVSRDLNVLQERGLIRRDGHTVFAAIDRMNAFLPVQARNL